MAEMYVEIVARARRFVDKCAMNKATELTLNGRDKQSGPLPEVDIRFPVLWLAHAKPKHCLDRERTKAEGNGERKEIYVGRDVA